MKNPVEEKIYSTSVSNKTVYSLLEVKSLAEKLSLTTLKDKKVITVAGTNGKGSTVKFLERFLKALNYKVGTYTSPHFYDICERICIDGAKVSESAFVQAVNYIKKNQKNIQLTYFELTTLAALYIFSELPLDYVILEIGLGGRLDAVNVVDNDLAIITSIGYDHMDYLGETLDEIAFEKSGIFRKNKAAVVAVRKQYSSIKQQAQKIGAKTIQLGNDYDYTTEHRHWCWSSSRKTIDRLCFPKLHLHNAATALAAIQELNLLSKFSTYKVNQILSDTDLIGRCHMLQKNNVLHILDVAHNEDSVEVLSKFLKNKHISGKIYAVFSMLSDKNLQKCLSLMKPCIDYWHIAPIKNPRSFTLEQLNDTFLNVDIACCRQHPDLKSAYQAAVINASETDCILIFGSFGVFSELDIFMQ